MSNHEPIDTTLPRYRESNSASELVAAIREGAETHARLYRAMETLEKSALEIKAQRDELLNAAKKGLGALYEIHGQGIGCPDCPPGEARTERACPAIVQTEAAIARVEAFCR